MAIDPIRPGGTPQSGNTYRKPVHHAETPEKEPAPSTPPQPDQIDPSAIRAIAVREALICNVHKKIDEILGKKDLDDEQKAKEILDLRSPTVDELAIVTYLTNVQAVAIHGIIYDLLGWNKGVASISGDSSGSMGDTRRGPGQQEPPQGDAKDGEGEESEGGEAEDDVPDGELDEE